MDDAARLSSLEATHSHSSNIRLISNSELPQTRPVNQPLTPLPLPLAQMVPNHAPPPPYYVQRAIVKVQVFAHHHSVSELWSTKWRTPCVSGIYPFVDGDVMDFDPIFAELVRISNDGVKILYDPDAYAAPFMPVAETLVSKASAAEAEGDTQKASNLYLRAAAVYRIARFPINRSPLSEKAWQAGKAAYLAGGKYLSPPVQEVSIPFTHGDASKGDNPSKPISAYLRIPTDTSTRPPNGWPLLLFICGLDAYKTDHTNRTTAHSRRGFAVLSLEIPGTGDCPASANDPEGGDRLFSSIFDWIDANASTLHIDPARVVARGVSTGGYAAFRVAHTHADRLFAAVGQGGGSHYMFEPEWIDVQNHMEYPFALADALAYKFGYDSVDAYKAGARKFSLLDAGVLEKRSCRLLVINGMEDSIFPIEDSLLVAMRGRAKDVVLREGLSHMGNPGGDDILYDWIDGVMKGS